MDWIIVTEHAAERWHQRAHEPTVGPIVAWNEGQRRSVPGLHGDEMRYHRDTETLLVTKDDVLVTVIAVPTAREDVRRAVYGVDEHGASREPAVARGK